MKKKIFLKKPFQLRMMLYWGSFERFSSLTFEHNEIFEKIAIFPHQNCLQAFSISNNDYCVLNLSKSTTDENPRAFAVSVKVSPNRMKFSPKNFHLHTTFINNSLGKTGGYSRTKVQRLMLMCGEYKLLTVSQNILS